MRKTLIALLLTASLPTLALAMPTDGPRGDGHHQGAHHARHGDHGGASKGLDLSREQRQQIRKLTGDYQHNRQAITQRYLDKLPAAEQKALQADRDAAKTQNQVAIRALLTPEQQKAFDAQQKQHAERRAERAEFEAWKAQKDAKAN